jgi:hypothetical protein
MLKQEIINKIDSFLLNVDADRGTGAFLVKDKTSSMASGTAYSAYHFRQALLGLPNDLVGKTKQEIQEMMKKKTNRENMNTYYYLRKHLKESGLPIEVVYGKNRPFEVIYHDKSILVEDNEPKIIHDSNNDDGDYLPDKYDIEFAAKLCSSTDVNVVLDKVEEIAKSRGKQLKSNWREITLNNLELWSSL